MAMSKTALDHLRNYWETLRAGRVAPYRAELDPRKFEDVLEHMFILEQLAPGQVRVRLAGMALCEMMGMEVRGMPPEAFIAAADRASFGSRLADVLGKPSVTELDLATEDSFGRPIKAQMLLLPLRSDFGEVTRILGCIVAERTNMRAPVNFAITAIRAQSIEVTEADTPATAHPGFAEEAAGFQGKDPEPELRAIVNTGTIIPTTPRRTGHLKVVSDD